MGCGLCPPTPKQEASSPSGEYVAGSYSFECGPMVPFNERVGLKLSREPEFHEVALILDAPSYSSRFNWTGPRTLQIIIDCLFTAAADCMPTAEGRSPRGHHITIQMRKRWKDVQIEYVVGPRLKSLGAGDI